MYRIGHGYDSHIFTEGKYITLAGVTIPFEKGLQSHSDGDVVIHSLCDALLGATSLGDMGQHFPDSDQQYAGAQSKVFLNTVKELIQEKKSMLNVTEKIEKYVFDNGGRLAFPTNLAINNVGAHWTPSSKTTDKFKKGDLVKLDVLLNGKTVDALAQLVFRKSAHQRAHEVCRRLKEEIPRHQFKIPIQGAVGSQIIARETIKGFRKDVLTKIHGGGARDRKRKLLDKQKKGKSKAKQFGKVEIPQEAFIGVLKINKET